MDSLKNPKNSLPVIRGDADAIVFDPKPNFQAFEFTPNLNARTRSLSDKFDRIAEDVRDALRERSLIRIDGAKRLLDLDFCLRRVKAWILLDNLGHQLFEMHHVDGSIDPAGPAISQHILDQPIQPIGRRDDSIQV